MKTLPLLAGLTPAAFLRDYWQKKPLLIRQAIPDFRPLLSREALFDLASREDVESRLVTRAGKSWRLAHGPLANLPSVKTKNWTLLVQGVNLHDDEADRLLRRFRFVPDARLDDLMISYATPDGGVGPHFDSYDVFLLQAHGTRRWRISAQKDLTLVEGLPLKILQNFAPEQEFDLHPGDMLYLPPHYAHDGIALDECMTYSIGFRAPTYQELGEGLLHFMADTVELDGRYQDGGLKPTSRPAEIGNEMVQDIADRMQRAQFTPDDILIFLGEYLSSPKPSTFFAAPSRGMSPAVFATRAMKRGIALSPKTRMLYKGRHLFINGESFVLSAGDRRILANLADARELGGEQLQSCSPDVVEAFQAWFLAGWLTLC